MSSVANRFAIVPAMRHDLTALLHLLHGAWAPYMRRDSSLFVQIPLQARLSAAGCPQAKLTHAIFTGMCSLNQKTDESSLLIPVNESIALRRAALVGPGNDHWFLPGFGFFIPGEYLIGLPLGLGAQVRALPPQAAYVQGLKPEYAAALMCPGCDCFAFNAKSELPAQLGRTLTRLAGLGRPSDPLAR
jgi:hypothetical protein